MIPVGDKLTAILNAPIRDKTLLDFSIGQFDNSGDVSFASSSIASYGNLARALEDTGISESYSVWAGSGLRGDGRQRILAPNMPYAQGFISSDISDAAGDFTAPPYVEFSFSELRSLGGITLTFDDVAKDYPAQITVYSYLDGALVTQTTFTDMAPVFVAEIFADGIDSIKIMFDKTREPTQGVKLAKILFGVGYDFALESVISYTFEESCDVISTKYPSCKMSFSIKNIDGFFSPVLNQNRMMFFSRNQTVTSRFWARDLISVPFAANSWQSFLFSTLKLQTWEVNGIEAKFTAVPQMERIKDMKISLQYYAAGTSIWRRINDIKSDIGVSEAIYGTLDIDDIICENPLPNGMPASEAIQLLANFGGYCMMYFRGSGTIGIERRRGTSDFSVFSASQTATGYSKLTDVGPDAISEYATWERDFFRGDGTQLILPDAAPYLNNGFVSSGVVTDGTETLEIICDAGGEQGQTANTVTVDFGGIVPEVMEVWQNAAAPGGAPQWQMRGTFYPTKSEQSFGVSIVGVFQYKLVLKNGSNNAMLGRRYHARNISSSFAENFTLSRNMIFYPTKFTSKAEYSSVSAMRQDVLYENEVSELGSIKVSGIGMFDIPISPAVNAYVTYSGANGSEDVSYAPYWEYVRIFVGTMGTNTGEITFTAYGQKAYYSTPSETRAVGVSGGDYHFENPLYNASSIDRNLDYAEAYVEENVIEEIECMAHPELEIGDYINLYDGAIGFIAKRVMKDGRDKFTIMRGTYDGMANT